MNKWADGLIKIKNWDGFKIFIHTYGLKLQKFSSCKQRGSFCDVSLLFVLHTQMDSEKETKYKVASKILPPIAEYFPFLISLSVV